MAALTLRNSARSLAAAAVAMSAMAAVAVTAAALALPARARADAAIVPQSDGVEIQSGALRLRVTALADDILRVRIARPGEYSEDSSWAVPGEVRARSVPVTAVPAGDSAVSAAAGFRTGKMVVRVERDPLRLIVADLQGHVISADAAAGAVEVSGAGFMLRKRLPESEHYFGLGDKTGPLDHRGQAFTNWNTDAYHFQEGTDPLYKTIPFFVAAGGAAGSYGIFLDNTWRSWFDFGKRDPQLLEFGASGGPIDYYLIYGPSPRSVIERYTDLTGRPPMPPAWALGFQQSRYSYMSAAEVRGVAARYRRERIPLDVIWLDIDYQNDHRPFTTNPVTFGDMPALARDLRGQGTRLVAITDLHIAHLPKHGYAPYDSGVEGDHFVKNPDGSTYVGEVWPGPSVFPDFTRGATRAWWGSLYGDFTAAGISGFWNDMNEPAVFKTPTKTMPPDTRHRIDEPGFAPRTATHDEIHNVYGMQNSRATFEGLQRLRPDERPFVMTRASYAGGQRYAVTWTGDNSATWNQLSLAISSLLNLGMSGFAYSGADVGGFIGTPSAELLTKWIEIAAFTPIMRVHSAQGTPRREAWVDGPRHTAIRRRFIEARYRLMPYLYALADDNSRSGALLMRPLFYDFPDALETRCEQPTAFMLGDRLLIAPPPDFESPAQYSVCLPAGDWYDFWTGAKVEALQVGVTPALERLPVFVRGGAILPRQPLVQSTAQTPQGPLSLDIYPGAGCRGEIYADDGHSMAFGRQGYLRQYVRCAQTDEGLVVEFEPRQGQYPPWWRTMQVRVHDWPGSARADLDGRVIPARNTPAPGRGAPPTGMVTVSIPDTPGPARLVIRRTGAGGALASELRWRDQLVSVIARPAGSAGQGNGGEIGARRSYHFSRNSATGDGPSRLVTEAPRAPFVRSGDTLFDGLFALALADAQLDRVSSIRDEAFDHGRPIDCQCFETGEKWHYVWTRDVSYAVDLGLGSLDPQHSMNSLLFKTSGVRAELLSDRLKPATVVVQDTGSGGSWPVSTDRVAWVMATSGVLDYLAPIDRPPAARKVFAVARDTIEQDRRFAFDGHAGLYRGETSFLDWREQNYPEWTRADVSSIAAGYAFSTNVLHLIAIEATAQLAAEVGAPEAGARGAARYRQWAQELRQSINARFWRAEAGMYASFLTAEPNSVASNSYDLLGLALAIIHGVADEKQARSILQHYPVSSAGPPVIWPEQADIAIYHNRAIWPFVTAYALRAAKVARQGELAGELVESLMRGAALSLSNMENFEFLTQQVRFEDDELTGPVIDSARQLWSVAGYLSLVQDTLWGLEVQRGQLTVEPWLPGRLAQRLFAGQRSVSLRGVHIAGAALNVTLDLPSSWPAGGWLEPEAVYVNGARLTGTRVDLRRLRLSGSNELHAKMRAAAASAPQVIVRIPFGDSRHLTAAERRAVFAPPAPTLLTAQRSGGGVTLTWQGTVPGTTVTIFANGDVLATAAAGTRFEDGAVRGPGTVCYSLTQRFEDTGLTSFPSREGCVSTPVPGGALVPNDGSTARVIDGVARYPDWGAPSQELASTFTATQSGWHRFELQYANSHGPINTGITAAVKMVRAQCTGHAEQSGSVVMPQLGAAGAWSYSTGFFFHAGAGAVCALLVADGFNMSYLSHFARYSGGQGGESGALNRADIAAARIELIGGRGR